MSAFKTFRKRVRPITLLLFALMASIPWQLKIHKAFDLLPHLWVSYAGVLIIAGGWIVMGYVNDAWAANPDKIYGIPWGQIVALVMILVVGATMFLFSARIYAHARLTIEHERMDAFVSGGDDCPALACRRDETGAVGFAWGVDENTWNGVCFDPTGAILAAEEAASEDRAAGRERVARLLGGSINNAWPLRGDWYGCSSTVIEPDATTAPTP